LIRAEWEAGIGGQPEHTKNVNPINTSTKLQTYLYLKTFLANMQSDSDHHLALSGRFRLIFFFARMGNAIFMEVTRNG